MITLLLHMHQPDYRHPRSGVPIMPWVRLHATRGYRDVPRLAAECGAAITVNLVPTLIEQIEAYAAGGSDVHLALCERPAEALLPAEADWLVTHALHGSPRAFEWFAGWGALRARRERNERFDTGALLDLQVWCNLAWFGATAVEDMPELAALRAKGAGFTEAEKQAVLAAQRRCLTELRGLYSALPDVSATPYAHPILPLLVDTGHAVRNLGPFDDPRFRAPDDALGQLLEGRRLVSHWVGRDVRGLWPSEGSVSPEAVEVFREAGFRWFATDSEVLRRSRSEGSGPVWEAGGMRAFFRDHGLSDRVGFVYADWPGEAAAEDLVRRVGDRSLVLALDGENPWESYRDAGAGFLRALFRSAPLRTASDLALDPPSGRISHLHTGSWIAADFRIWIGHDDDRRAWRLLRDVRARWVEAGRPESAQRALWRAEASDWFWWYGPEFHTPFAGEFDTLFRAHLAEVIRLLGDAPWPQLEEPIGGEGAQVHPPVGCVYPERTDFFAWNAAGWVAVTTSAMAPGPGWPSELRFGWSGGRLALHLVGAAPGWRVELGGRVLEPDEGVVWAPNATAEAEPVRVRLVTPDGRNVPEGAGWLLSPPVARLECAAMRPVEPRS